MKTSEEWVDQFKTDGDGESTHSELSEYMVNFVRRVQSDALFHASSHIYRSVGEQMMHNKIPNCSGIAHEIEVMAIDLNNK